MTFNTSNYNLIKERLDRAGVPLERQALILAQFKKESGDFNKTKENMNYSAERIHAVWPSRFPTVKSAEAYANDPKKLANKVYGGRMGNTETDDGWNYRGRGFIQLTGKDNYKKYSKLVYGDEDVLLDNPELLEDPEVAAEVSLAYLNDTAKNATTADEFTRAVNAGTSQTDYANRRKASEAFTKQLALKQAGLDVTADGDWGPQSKRAWDFFNSGDFVGTGINNQPTTAPSPPPATPTPQGPPDLFARPPSPYSDGSFFSNPLMQQGEDFLTRIKKAIGWN